MALMHCSILALSGGVEKSRATTVDYIYDLLYHLTAADYSNGGYYHYIYDAVANVR